MRRHRGHYDVNVISYAEYTRWEAKFIIRTEGPMAVKTSGGGIRLELRSETRTLPATVQNLYQH